MNPKHVLIAVPLALLVLGGGTAIAATSKNETGAFVCINDKWDEKELEKGHKLVDYAGRCISIPDDPSVEKYSEDCVGKYEYMPDQSWKGTGSCTQRFKDGTTEKSFAEGSQLKEYSYKILSGTGKFNGASGSGTYTYDNITETLSGGRFKSKMDLP